MLGPVPAAWCAERTAANGRAVIFEVTPRPDRRLDYVEAIANAGTGVFETLKLISKLTLRTLRRR